MEELKNNIINFRVLLLIFWKEKKIFSLIVLLVSVVSIIYAFSLKEEFVSQGMILPEVQTKDGKLDGLAGLASLAGVDIGGGGATDAFRPDLYPIILQSTPFFLELFNQTVTTRENKQMNFENFYHKFIEKNEEISEKRIKKFPVKENGFLVLNLLSEERIEDLKDRIKAYIDKKSGVISISVKMPDPVVAASLTRFAMIYLTDYITKYRTEKNKQNVDFLKEKMDTAKGKFYSSQSKRAQYSDQFQLPTIRLQSADIQRERIESEYRMSSAFYGELVKKYEEANINYQQSIPVYQVLNPPVTPTKKSEPKRAIIIIIGIIIGCFVALLTILLKNKNYKLVLDI